MHIEGWSCTGQSTQGSAVLQIDTLDQCTHPHVVLQIGACLDLVSPVLTIAVSHLSIADQV